MRALRPALLTAAVAVVSLAASASAATGPRTLHFSDPAGDNISPSAASDITGVTFTTTGKGKGRQYQPRNLVVTLTLAKPPTSDGMVLYGVDAELAGCGDFYLQYMPGARLLDSFNYADCGGDGSDPTGNGASFDAVPEVKGNSIIWTVPFKAPAVPLKPGSTFTGINAQTDFVDPATSIVGPYTVTGQALYDTAETASPYTAG